MSVILYNHQKKVKYSTSQLCCWKFSVHLGVDGEVRSWPDAQSTDHQIER